MKEETILSVTAKAEVVQNSDDVCCVTDAHIAQLKSVVGDTPRKRIRINLHQSADDPLHQMLIVLQSKYNQPHKHTNKPESFHMLEGEVRIVLFDDAGEPVQLVELAEPGRGKSFCYRLAPDTWHMVIPVTETAVFHEITTGPFVAEERCDAPWAPQEGDAAAEGYVAAVLEQLT